MGISRRAALVAVLLGLVGALVPLQAATAQDADYQQVIDLTFPTDPRVRFSDTYDACRSGCTRRHKAADLMGQKLWPEYATVDGVVCRIDEGPEDSYGRHLTLCGDDGRRYRYLHLNNDTPGTDDGRAGLEHVYAPGIREGLRVARGQLLAYMGDSGNAEDTGPHLHLDIFDDRVVDPYGDNRINPYPSLVAALQRGDVADGSALFADPADRTAGSDRVATAIALARTRFEQASTALLAPADRPSEAIVAGPLADVLDAPVFVTAPTTLDDRVAQELRDLGVQRVYLVGGVLPGDPNALAGSLGLRDGAVTRLGGEDVFQTAAAVADLVWEQQGAEASLPEPVVGTPAPAREPAGLRLQVSPQPDRSDPYLLEDATVAGDVYVSLAGTGRGVDHVDFLLDGEPVHREQRAPYDLAGGADEAATPWNTTAVADGAHTITAVVTRWDGSTTDASAAFTVANAAPPTGGLLGETAPSATLAPRLEVSASLDRTDPVLLEDAIVSGSIAVQVTGPTEADTAAVAFWIDDPAADREPDQREEGAPWDLAGTRRDGRARPWDTTTLDNGTHTVTAVVARSDGTTEATTASFEVRNATPRRALLALGSHPDPSKTWPDALVASYYGAALDRPVLLTAHDHLPEATATALDGVTEVTIVGGPVAIDDAVQTEVDTVAGEVARLWGEDRYETATTVTDDLVERGLVSIHRVWAATGWNWPDAATAGPTVAYHGDALVLVDGWGLGGIDDRAQRWLISRADRIEAGQAIGGPVAIGDGALLAFRLAIT